MRRFLLVIFGLLFLGNFVSWFAIHTLLVRLAAPEAARWALAGFILLQVGGIVMVFALRMRGYQPGTGMGRPLLSLFMIWSLLLALPTAAISLIWLLIWLLVDAVNHGSVLDPGTRAVGLIATALPFLTAFILTLVALWQLGRFRIRRMSLSIPNLPAALEGFTIAHLSDLHIGKLTRGRVLDKMVVETNQLDADVIVLTGDLINMSLVDLPKAFEILRAMKAQHGLYLCEGNHDLIESRVGFESAIRSSGLNFLLNDSATFSVKGQPVQMLGLRWGEGMGRGRETGSAATNALRDLLARRGAGDFTILLAHHPDAFDEAAEAGIPLTLAGHTHGGQLMVTPRWGFGSWLFRYWSGWYQKGASQLVVSNGTGNWFPLRIQAPAEIIYITLRGVGTGSIHLNEVGAR